MFKYYSNFDALAAADHLTYSYNPPSPSSDRMAHSNFAIRAFALLCAIGAATHNCLNVPKAGNSGDYDPMRTTAWPEETLAAAKKKAEGEESTRRAAEAAKEGMKSAASMQDLKDCRAKAAAALRSSMEKLKAGPQGDNHVDSNAAAESTLTSEDVALLTGGGIIAAADATGTETWPFSEQEDEAGGAGGEIDYMPVDLLAWSAADNIQVEEAHREMNEFIQRRDEEEAMQAKAAQDAAADEICRRIIEEEKQAMVEEKELEVTHRI